MGKGLVGDGIVYWKILSVENGTAGKGLGCGVAVLERGQFSARYSWPFCHVGFVEFHNDGKWNGSRHAENVGILIMPLVDCGRDWTGGVCPLNE